MEEQEKEFSEILNEARDELDKELAISPALVSSLIKRVGKLERQQAFDIHHIRHKIDRVKGRVFQLEERRSLLDRLCEFFASIKKGGKKTLKSESFDDDEDS